MFRPSNTLEDPTYLAEETKRICPKTGLKTRLLVLLTLSSQG